MKYSQMTAIQLLLLMILVIQPFSLCKRLTRSGIYIENRENQTIPYQFASRREKRAFADNILIILDLPTKFNRSRNKTLQLNSPASRFIRDVYRSSTRKQKDRSFKFTDADLKAIQDSDIILSYSVLKRQEHQAKNTLLFDISETPKFSNAIRSELRVYVRPSADSIWKISLFDSQGFVDSIKVTEEGWIKLNTGRVLRRWLTCSDCNNELYLSTVNLENGIDDSDVLVLYELQRQPFLVGYFVNLYHASIHFTVPNIRTQRSPRSKTLRNYLENPYFGQHENYRRRRTSCAIHSLHVRFSELGFNGYIVEPEGFDAHYCHGDCRFPLTAHMNATNHALVQTLVHFLQPNLVPRVLCAPREYNELSVFYSRDGYNFVYKIYRQMIVKSCGCC